MFDKFGSITDLQLRKRKDGFTYAHIQYESIEQASKAILEMNRKKIKDKILKVSFTATNCQPKWQKLHNQSKV